MNGADDCFYDDFLEKGIMWNICFLLWIPNVLNLKGLYLGPNELVIVFVFSNILNRIFVGKDNEKQDLMLLMLK